MDASNSSRPSVSDSSSPLHIVVMGSTGVGKSRFINRFLGANVADSPEVGHGLQSCTHDVVEYPFEFDGCKGIIFDTPGFDDTFMNDAKILCKIADYFESTYRKHLKINAILYLHDITMTRMGGSQIQVVNLFQKLCGEMSFKNVVIVTTKWDVIKGTDETPAIGVEREKELLQKHLKTIVAFGAKNARHDGSPESAQNIVRSVLQYSTTITKLQQELVDEKKSLEDTEAGHFVDQDLVQRLAELEKQRAQFEEMWKGAKKDKEIADEELKENVSALKKEREKLKEKQTSSVDWAKITFLALEGAIKVVDYCRKREDTSQGNQKRQEKQEPQEGQEPHLQFVVIEHVGENEGEYSSNYNSQYEV